MEPKLKLPKGVENKTGQDGFVPNGNFTFTDDFKSEKLDYNWIGLRGPREDFISKTKDGLQINPFANNIKQVAPTSTLFLRQMHDNFSYSATMDYTPQSETDLAGIVALQSEGFNYVFGITKKGDEYYILLEKNRRQRRSRETNSEIVGSTKIDISKPIRLKVSAVGDKYEFSYSTNGTDFKNLGGTVSGDILSTDVAGGFTGCLLGLYATSTNDALPE
jgi:alpha-N-arabinofuranosidase